MTGRIMELTWARIVLVGTGLEFWMVVGVHATVDSQQEAHDADDKAQ